MTASEVDTLAELYELDETAWLDQMSTFVRAGEVDLLDLENLAEYLSDMATRDRREVTARMAVLMAHLLMWNYQPQRRSRSWKNTIETQRFEFELLLKSRTLRRHADASIATAYRGAVRQAMSQTGFSKSTFPKKCPYSVEDLLKLETLPD